ncbi:MAG: hypothetical protein GX163_06735 [Bacteroidetes bacterium]|jgi:hypothetical protein|nr:hypothetical protein [Bacteroidota bacterium]
MSKYLTREQILTVDDMIKEEVPVPEWGGTVLVKRLSGEERDRYEDSLYKQEGKKYKLTVNNIKARLAAYSIIDENGNRIFTEVDIAELGKKSAKALNRVADVCRKLSGFTDEDMNELTKNSEATTTEDSPSA